MSDTKNFTAHFQQNPLIYQLRAPNFAPPVYQNPIGHYKKKISANIDSKITMSAIDIINAGTNLLTNGNFETRTSWASAANWTINYPWWLFYSKTDTSASPQDWSIISPKVYAGNNSLSTRFNITDTYGYPDITYYYATSGSFAFSGGSNKRLTFRYSIYSKNGVVSSDLNGEEGYSPIPIENPYSRAVNLEAITTIYIYLYNSNSQLIQTIIPYSGQGNTYGDGENIGEEPTWINRVLSTDIPSATEYAKVRVRTGIVTQPGNNFVGTLPIVCVDNLSLEYAPVDPVIKTKLKNITMASGVSFTAITPNTIEIPHEDSLLALSGDTDTTGSGLNTAALKLHFGNESGTQTWTAWLPFSISGSATPLSSLVTGIHVTSAKLTLTAAENISLDLENRCKFKVGFALYGNQPPTSGTDLKSKTIFGPQTSQTISESWISGQTLDVDITNPLRYALGRLGGGDPNGVYIPASSFPIAAIISDNGSANGEKRTFVSYEGNQASPSYQQAKITYNYAYNSYLKVDDTYITSASSLVHARYYNEPIILIGEKAGVINRGIIRFDLSVIPPGATVNSASLYLYAISAQGTASGTLGIYSLLSNRIWDASTSSWVLRYTAHPWGTNGGLSGTDYNATAIGSISVPASPSGYLSTTLNQSYIQSIVSNSAINNGLFMKFTSESNNLKTFASSENTNVNKRPYLLVNTSSGSYLIKGDKPGSGDGGPGETTGLIEKVSHQSLLNSNALSMTYNLQAPVNSNRYVLVSYGKEGTADTITEMHFNGINMTKIVENLADSGMTIWGVVVPNNLPPGGYVIDWVKQGYAGYKHRITLFATELKGVSQSDPIYKTFKTRVNADSSTGIQTDSSSILYLAGGYVYSSFIVLKNKTNFSFTLNNLNQLLFSYDVDSEVHRTAYYKNISQTAGGRAEVSASWPSFTTSDSTLACVSLRPA